MFDISSSGAKLEELIFAGRNKEYGAKKLREAYRQNISLAMWVVIILFTLITLIPFSFRRSHSNKGAEFSRQKIVQVFQLSEPPSIDESMHTSPAEQIATAPVPTNKFLLPVVKPDEQVVSEPAWYADTTHLENIYAENTLHVQIKYPYGWTYIDQNVKNRLDGVVFWGATNLYNPPPYIQLGVMDKDLFIPSKYKYHKEFNTYTIYYNDPEALSDQYSRVIYIRTDTDVDYTLKLIMKGKKQFEDFEPVFFGMLETFTFGD